MKINHIYNEDNLQILKTFPDNSIDSIVTDPPYGLGKTPDVLKMLNAWIYDGYLPLEGKGFMGHEWDVFVPQPLFWREIFRILKPGGHILSFFGTRTYDWGVLAMRIAGFEIRDQLVWVHSSGFPKNHNISIEIDKMNVKDSLFDIINTVNEDATQWKGWGTALKPAIEPIVLARKPIQENTISKNVLIHKVGGINIDKSRIKGNVKKWSIPKGGFFKDSINNDAKLIDNPLGRFPTNFIHDGSKEVEKIFTHTKSGFMKAGTKIKSNVEKNVYDSFKNRVNKQDMYDDKGSASRFFYCARASKAERNAGLKNLKNIHPTVKPLRLMEYLIQLITPTNGIVLDPFVGSGTTCMAAKKLKIKFIGIEKNNKYYKIAINRINSIKIEHELW